MKALRYIITALSTVLLTNAAYAFDLSKSTLVYDKSDHALAEKIANTLADDIERVSGTRPVVGTKMGKGTNVILSTSSSRLANVSTSFSSQWECYRIDADASTLRITGSDARGLAYGAFHISERIGVSPWYWFADVPVQKSSDGTAYYPERTNDAPSPAGTSAFHYESTSPTIKYRGIFINDEDWGLKTWASLNYEKELGDIGPRTYDRVCELILRLRGNMLAPAMHSCTGAFYSHPESQKVADSWGIMITTSHCEPLLFNNASETEWKKERDGEWNYITNKQVILDKLDRRISETGQYDNIYTMGMRGLHDEAMKGSENPTVRARTLEQVFADQRNILTKYKKQAAEAIPQIFVPYKETLDIYDAGLKVPEDITIVWPDDNYGYMKRVSNPDEQKRTGGSGVYYHLSYLGTPHDNLWVSTTSPTLMYEELKKAYDAGADRYWLLNVGDIKPMEMEMQQFFEMAWNIHSFSYDNANTYQAAWLAHLFGNKYMTDFQDILDNYYRLAWQRKPEFMGYEIEWDNKENERLHDSDFSFTSGSAQKRLQDYQRIADRCNEIYESLPQHMQPAFFEILSFSVNASNLINRKFLFAQRNHETGSDEYARQSLASNSQIESLLNEYNTLLSGKWNQMMSQVPPGFCAQYQGQPEYVSQPTDRFRLPAYQHYTEYANSIDLSNIQPSSPFRIIRGIGCDWTSLQLGEPFEKIQESSAIIDIPLPIESEADSIRLQICAIPFWPVSTSHSNRFAVSIDDATPIVCENPITEWSMPWKLQVLSNRKDYLLTIPLSRQAKDHKLRLHIIDSGQMIQKITWETTTHIVSPSR